MAEKSVSATSSTPLGRRIWFSAIFFGLIGQIAWVVENMFFAKFGQDLFDTRGHLYFTVTTLMVILSAVTATVTTIFAGGLIDKTGKRKPFITFGYLIWGVTIMLFAAIPIDFSDDRSWGIIAALVVLDCVMTFFGSTANDAAFNTWVADVTDVTNRGKVNTILSVMPVIATVLVFGIGMATYDNGATVEVAEGVFQKVSIADRDPLMIKLFFIIIGVFPMIGGLVSAFVMKDAPGIVKQQVFMSYLINFIEKTLGITDYILPLAAIIVVGAVITGVLGIFFDKLGRKKFYFPLLAILVVGAIVVYCMQFMDPAAYLPVLIAGGAILLGAILSLSGALTASFQDYIPKGAEGRFQGVRMCFTVLIPMALGIGIAQAVGINSLDAKDPGQVSPPFELFLAAAIIVAIAAIPLIWVVKDSDRLRSSLMERKLAEESAASPAPAEIGEAIPADEAAPLPAIGNDSDEKTIAPDGTDTE